MALIEISNLASHPIQEGDAGIILRKDGSFQIFNTHAALDADNLTDRQMEQAEMLMAFAVAIHVPAVMEVLKQMAADPLVVGDKVFDAGAPQ